MHAQIYFMYVRLNFQVPPVFEMYLLIFIFIDVVMKSCWRCRFYWKTWKHRNISILKVCAVTKHLPYSERFG